MSRIAIIGAGGYVGLSLIESLVLSEAAKVVAVVRGYRNMAGLCRYGGAVDIRLANAEDVSSLTRVLDGVATVVNVTTGPPAGIVRSTHCIYDACVRAQVQRLVHVSSAVVFGDVCSPAADDDPPLDRHWMPYARAKAAAETWLRPRLRDAALDVVVLRPGIVWGPRSPHTMQIASALARKSICLVDGGRGVFNGVYIANLLAGIQKSCEQQCRASGFYNVGDEELVTWRDFLGALGRPLGCDPGRLPKARGERFPWSFGAAIDAIQSLSPVNALYHRGKGYVPDWVKAMIRGYLEGSYSFDRQASSYAPQATVDRELWHLQRVRHKLPIGKFAQTFHFSNPVPFDEGMRRTVAWLETLGWMQRDNHASA